MKTAIYKPHPEDPNAWRWVVHYGPSQEFTFWGTSNSLEAARADIEQQRDFLRNRKTAL